MHCGSVCHRRNIVKFKLKGLKDCVTNVLFCFVIKFCYLVHSYSYLLNYYLLKDYIVSVQFNAFLILLHFYVLFNSHNFSFYTRVWNKRIIKLN